MKALFKVPKALSYNGDPNNWNKFKQQFEIYMKATGLENDDSEKKVNVFLNIAGDEALGIYNSLKLNENEKKDFDAVIKNFDEFCKSKQNLIYKSFKFFTRVQESGEYFNDFYNDLKIMANFCNFGDQKDRLIRDRIIAGIKHKDLQEKFLKAPDLSLQEVIDVCYNQEKNNLQQTSNVKHECDASYDNTNEESNNNNDEKNLTNEFELNQTLTENEPTNDTEEDEDVEDEEEAVQINSTKRKPVRVNRRGKVLEKRKKAQTIQMKIAEIKKNITNTIKNEVDSEQMGIRQKFTRSSFRKIEVKGEPWEESEEEVSLNNEEQYEDQTFTNENQEEFDIYAFHDDTSIDENVTNSLDNYEQEQEKKLIKQEMTQAEYINEKKTSRNSTRVQKSRKQSKRNKRTDKSDIKIIEVQRDNMPPLILKSVKKKTLLLGKMPYPCKKCDLSFWTSMQLERHQLVHVLKKVPPVNNSTPKKVFKCEECGKEFKKICDLERHTRVHTGEKPSVCNICNKRFQQAYNLHKHLLIHTQEKNFECIICQKKFGRSDVLNRHVLTHSIDKPFHCNICSKTFIRNTQLSLHLKKHHGKEATDNQETVNPIAGKSSD